ncbi:P-Type ATPase, partial [Hepatospora eriocheir]
MKRKQKIVFKNDHEDEFNIGEHEDEKSKSIEISKKFIKLTSFRPRQDSNNTIKNTKYTVLNFIPYLIFYQFNTKSSAYFILIMFLQLNDKICVSSKFASFFPFIFILCIAATNELIDDFKRYQRDNLSNNITYNVYSIGSSDYRVVDNNFFELMEYYSEVKSADLKVGNIILIKKGQKVPADCLLLCTSDENNEVYIKTDQLDGETDWKKREAISNIRELDTEMVVQYEEPSNEIYSFTGILETKSMPPQKIPLELSNTAWADTTIANSDVLGLIIYTGNNTRVKMNTYKPRNKVGIFDKEVDLFSIILIVISALSTLTFVIMRGSHYPSFDILIFTLRFLVLFSYIIPIALKVMINISRLYYSYHKPNGVGIRSSSIQEELARITYFLTDKTGTLTCNVMTLKKLHLGTVCFSTSSIEDFKFLLKSYLSHSKGEFNNLVKSGNTKIIIGMNMMFELLEALSICHLVTPVLDGDNITFQASSAEEVAMVQFLEKIGIQLYSKIDNIVSIKYTIDDVSVIVKYKIHVVFSFSSELKRMGIVAQRIDFFEFTKLNISGKFNEYVFFIKGADSVIIPLCKKSPWALEESDNMAREGLRTLLFAKKELQTEEFEEFYKRYSDAKISIYNRGEKLLKVQNDIEVNCDLLGLSGIEDKLQEGVRETIEKLRGAEIKVWMLTGDKIHTAISIAKSSKLISRIDKYKVIENCVNKEEILKVLNEIEKKSFNSLVIDGTSIGTILKHSERIFNSKNRITILDKFISITTKLSTVIGCRFTPTQKAMIARVMKKGDKGAVCCIGDGGNDVSMITEANV